MYKICQSGLTQNPKCAGALATDCFLGSCESGLEIGNITRCSNLKEVSCIPRKSQPHALGIVDSIADNVAPFVKNSNRDFICNRKLGFIQLIRFCLSMESGCISCGFLKFFNFDVAEVPHASAFIQ